MMQSNAFSGQFQFTDAETGFEHIKQAANQYIGSAPIPWYISYCVWLGAK